MDPPQDFKSLQDQIQAALVSTTRTAGQISAEDLNFQRSLNPSIGILIDEQTTRLLALSKTLLNSAASLTQSNSPSLQELDDVDNNWRNVVDVVDSLLEKADTCLDEYTGVIKRRSPPVHDESSKSKKNPYSLGNSFRNQNLLKPQLGFQVKPDNHDDRPWKPLLVMKPHATIPLEESLGTFTDELQHQQFRHPYETEIVQLKYPDAIYEVAEPIEYQPADTTTATFVDTFEGVLNMLAELKGCKEIAVDLEHHDTRTYVGLVSLMQISTRKKDWIVDTLKSWREDLQVLNEVFADPEIIKVFHGAYMDIVWLQRDLGLYIVGLFDTHHACRVLGYPGGSLAYLLKRFVDFDADKKYQLADWRIRPLPNEMFFYARADTHYLLYIYDNLRNELVEKSNRHNPEENRIEAVLEKSKETSLLRFERHIYDNEAGRGPQGWYNLLIKTPALLNDEQFAVFKAVHEWRDQVARKDDDSINYVMPNHVIFTLARLMPTDLAAVYGAVHPISYNVKSRVNELLQTIRTAKVAGKNGPSMMDVLRPESVGAIAKVTKSEHTKQPDTRQGQVPIVDEGSLRNDKSNFWGNAFGSSVWDSPSSQIGHRLGLRLAVPLPPVVSESIQNYAVATLSQPRAKTSSPTPAKPEPVKDETFVLKTGRKRKSSTSEDSTPLSSEPTYAHAGVYDIDLNDEEKSLAAQKASSKAARKAEKRATKRQRKLEKAKIAGEEAEEPDDGEAEAEPEAGEEEVFDYSKADSVLHSKPRTGDGSGKGMNNKPFDPYAKSSDAPGGMRRVQSERAGKSFTFKS